MDDKPLRYAYLFMTAMIAAAFLNRQFTEPYIRRVCGQEVSKTSFGYGGFFLTVFGTFTRVWTALYLSISARRVPDLGVCLHLAALLFATVMIVFHVRSLPT
ncbi:MAG: hypothetical protein AAFR91_13345 [Pseudomonadota bacterium]